MSARPPPPSPSSETLHRALPLLLILFVGSGCAALIYEIVWFQMLQLVVGSSAVSLAVLLGTFMGGMCLGSLALARVVPATWHPLRVYAMLELAIGAIGVAVLFAMPAVSRIYVASVGHGMPGILLRAAVAGVCLLPPTMAMGATLPAISRWVDTTPRGVSWLGFFYGGNTAGAVVGCLLAGFYLLRVHDIAVATGAAVSLNLVVALLGLVLAARNPMAAQKNGAPTYQPAPRNVWFVYVAIALSGMSALGAEVVWTRLLSLMLGGTVYTFSIILAVFLVGIGLGSSAGAALARSTVRPRLALGVCQALLTAAIAWTAFMIARSLPYWPIDLSLSQSPWFNFQLDLLRCLWAVLPPACLWGASFPLAVAAAATPGQDPARLTGGIYAANTVGAIVGALGFSLLLVSAGTHRSEIVLVALAALAALLVLVPTLTPRTDPADDPAPSRWPPLAGAAGLLAFAALAAVLAAGLPPIPPGLIAWGRYLPSRDGKAAIVYTGEGRNSSVAVSEWSEGVRYFHVSGKVEASTEPQDMRLQRMLGHLPALLHPNPRSVLIVGCGAGVTAGSFVVHPGIERIVICEIEPLIPRVVARYFAEENHRILEDPRLEIVYDDARHFLLTTREKFDIVTSDPIHPWVKGAATLYTKEYHELCRDHLNPRGLITQWVPLYESQTAAVKSEIATFFSTFPEGTVWSNDEVGKGYDTVVLGQIGPMRIDVDALQQKLARADHAAVARSLADVGFKSTSGLLATYAGRGRDLTPWLADAEINRDRNLRLQYLAGMGSNLYRSDQIHSDMLAYRRFPEELFVGTAAGLTDLRRAMGWAK